VCAEDALEFIMAGATAVEIGTACLTSPDICLSILEGIEHFLMDKGWRISLTLSALPG